MKKIIEIAIKIFIILCVSQFINIPIVKADGYWDNTINSANKFIKKKKSAVQNEAPTDDTKLQDMTDNIYNILLSLGIVLSVIVGGILGIQLMWGSVEQQVKAKEMLLPYAMGCVVIFGAFGIWKLCLTIFSQL